MKNEEVIDGWKRIIEGQFIDPATENPWEIKKRLPSYKIQAKLAALTDEYSGRLVKHLKSQGIYRITHFTVLNKEGMAEYAVNYHPYDENTKQDYERVKYTRPAKEFFDGRFIY